MKFSLLSGVAAAGFATLAIYNYQTAQANQEHADREVAQVATLNEEVTLLRGSKTSSNLVSAETAAMQDTLSTASADKPTPAGVPAQDECDPGTALQYIMDHQAQKDRESLQALSDPTARAKQRNEIKESSRSAHQEMLTELGLSHELEEQLLELMADQSIDAHIRAQSISDPAALLEARQSLGAEHNVALLNLLGQKKYAEYQHYNDTFQQRDALNDIGRRIALPAEQRKRVMDALVKQNINIMMLHGEPDKVLPHLKSALTAEQYKALNRSLPR